MLISALDPHFGSDFPPAVPLGDTDFREASFTAGATDTSFRRACFTRCLFTGVRMTGCDFSGCEFRSVRFVNCDFSGSRFASAFFDGCVMTGVKMLGCDCTDSVIRSCLWESCNFSFANFDHAQLRALTSRECNFDDASLSACTQKDWRPEGCRMRRVSFFQTRLSGVDLSDCELEALTLSDTMSELRGVTMAPGQCVLLARRLGIRLV